LIFWIKGAAIASLCVVGTVAVVHQVAAIKHTKIAAGSSPLDGRASRTLAVPRSTSAALVEAPAPLVEAPAPLVETPAPLVEAPAPRLVAPALPMVEVPARAQPIQTPIPAVIERRPANVVGASASVPSMDPAPRDPLAREAAMLEEARAMLEKNPRGSLAALDRYATSFPSGLLSIERDLLVVDALRRLGRPAEARARAAALLDRARGSLYEPRIRAMLAE